jgi:hypothetical protein
LEYVSSNQGVGGSNPSGRTIYLIYNAFLRFCPALSSRDCAVSLEPVRAHQQQVVSVAAASRLGRQLEEVIASLSKVDGRRSIFPTLL